jgi:hypothetical protein
MAVRSRNPCEPLPAAAAIDPRGQSRMKTVFEGHWQSPRARSATWGGGGGARGEGRGGREVEVGAVSAPWACPRHPWHAVDEYSSGARVCECVCVCVCPDS